MDAEKVKEFRQHQVKQIDKLLNELEADFQILVSTYMNHHFIFYDNTNHPDMIWERPLVNLKRLRGACNFLAK